MAHEAHPSLATLAERKINNATWAKIHDVTQSLTNLQENKVVGDKVEHFKNHPDFQINDDNKSKNDNIDKNNDNPIVKTNKKQKNKLNKLSIDDIKALKAMIEECKKQENDNPSNNSNKNLLNVDDNKYAADFMSMDFNSPQMLNLYDEMNEMLKDNKQ